MKWVKGIHFFPGELDGNPMEYNGEGKSTAKECQTVAAESTFFSPKTPAFLTEKGGWKVGPSRCDYFASHESAWLDQHRELDHIGRRGRRGRRVDSTVERNPESVRTLRLSSSRKATDPRLAPASASPTGSWCCVSLWRGAAVGASLSGFTLEEAAASKGKQG